MRQRVVTHCEAGQPLARWMLRGRKTKHWMRMIYGLQSIWKLKRSATSFSYRDYLQAGKSVAGIAAVEPAGEIVRRFRRAAEASVSPNLQDGPLLSKTVP